MEWDFEQRYARLKQFLPIDILAIDQELMQQPAIFQDAAEMAAELKAAERTAKHNLEIAQAKVAEEMRNEKRDKPYSESAINSKLILDPRVQRARTDREDLMFDSELATVLANSLEAKTRLLRSTSDLMNSGFITPSSSYNRAKRDLIEARPPPSSRIQLKKRAE